MGLPPARLSARLRVGETVAEDAAERGVKLQRAVDAALSRYRDVVRWRVEDGYISRGQADELLQLMEEQLRVAFDRGRAQRCGPGYGYDDFGGYGGYRPGPGMMGGWGPMGGMMVGSGPGRWGW